MYDDVWQNWCVLDSLVARDEMNWQEVPYNQHLQPAEYMQFPCLILGDTSANRILVHGLAESGKFMSHVPSAIDIGSSKSSSHLVLRYTRDNTVYAKILKMGSLPLEMPGP